jgi:site-specific DNA-methyltransferase (adenine-specific)/site-specific DNA-methyltransferase (cytosine-N4-specific)
MAQKSQLIEAGPKPFATGKIAKGGDWTVHQGDAGAVLQQFPDESFDCVITSPPYYSQRDYEVEGQIGLEPNYKEYVSQLTAVMDEVKRTLNKSGVLFLNLGDTYYSGKGKPKGRDPKNNARRFGLRPVDASGQGVPRKTTMGIPWRVALAMIDQGWVLRSPVIWQRHGSVPEPTAKDRPWRTYETVFIFAKSRHYHFNREPLREASEEDIWTISNRRKNNGGVHSAAFPDELVERCLALGCQDKGKVLDPFAGSGTVLRVATAAGHSATGIDLSPVFCDYMAKELK